MLRKSLYAVSLIVVLTLTGFSAYGAETVRTHPTPPMGWNSYTGYSIAVTEAELLRNIDFLSENLLAYGYDTVTVDNGWFLSGQGEGISIALDQYGRPDSHKHFFPHGLKYTIDYAHGRGVKFGIWLLRGINRRAVEENLPVEGTPYHMQNIVNKKSICPWAVKPWWNYGVDMTKPGAQAYYDGLIQKYADMGVDFIKFDDIVPNPDEVEAVVKAIEKCDRKIVLSLSPGDHIKVEHSSAYQKADMVRITSDIWDNRGSLETAFRRWEAMQDYAGPEMGSFLDMDMICFGRLYVTRNGGRNCKFTPAQKRTFMVQRALAASPLMLGGVLYSMDKFSLSLFKHPEILACNKNAVIGKLVHRDEKTDVWKTPEKGHKNAGWIGIFNRDGKNNTTIKLDIKQLGLKGNQAYALTNLWAGRALPVADSHRFDIPADDVAFIRYKPVSTTATKPNIIYILVDDLGYGDLGCYGQEIIKTPNIDRLAAEGMRFTDHYAGSTVCAPSRCALMTGKHTGHTTVVNNAETARDSVPMGDRGAAGQKPLQAGEVTLARLAKQAGYQTACIGKWGMGSRGSTGDPSKVGFDHFFGYYDQRDAHYFYIDWLWRNGAPVELKDNPRLHNQYSHDLLFNESVNWIKAHKDNPFFLYLSFTIPHAELIVPEESMKPYDGITERGPWGNTKAEYKIEREQWGLYNACGKPHQTFAGMISRMDRDIGRLLDLLKESNLDGNTVIMFTSDNGPHNEGGADPAFFKSAGPLRGGKRSLHEGGIRVPFIAWQPGKIKAGTLSNHVSAFWDVMPTLCDLMQVDTPQDTDGISLLPTLYDDGPQAEHDYLYWQYAGNQAVRRGPWKLLGNNKNARLFNLETDINEKINVASKHPALVKELESLYETAKQ